MIESVLTKLFIDTYGRFYPKLKTIGPEKVYNIFLHENIQKYSKLFNIDMHPDTTIEHVSTIVQLHSLLFTGNRYLKESSELSSKIRYLVRDSIIPSDEKVIEILGQHLKLDKLQNLNIRIKNPLAKLIIYSNYLVNVAGVSSYEKFYEIFKAFHELIFDALSKTTTDLIYMRRLLVRNSSDVNTIILATGLNRNDLQTIEGRYFNKRNL